MLTPSFDLSQNDDFLIIAIQLPYAKISEIDIHYEDTDFIFYSKPYYLRLNLPGRVQYSAEPSFDYDVDKKLLTVKAQKAEKGQVFEGLDLITKLLAPKKIKTPASPMIEVIDGTDASQDDDDEEEFDWSVEQIPCEELSSLNILGKQCGFGNSYSYAVFKMKEEVKEIFDVEDPQDKQPSLRRQERLKTESEQFDEDHYIADLYHDEEIQQLLKYRPEWDDLYDETLSDSSVTTSDDIIEFSPNEKERLLKLPNKECAARHWCEKSRNDQRQPAYWHREYTNPSTVSLLVGVLILCSRCSVSLLKVPLSDNFWCMCAKREFVSWYNVGRTTAVQLAHYNQLPHMPDAYQRVLRWCNVPSYFHRVGRQK